LQLDFVSEAKDMLDADSLKERQIFFACLWCFYSK